MALPEEQLYTIEYIYNLPESIRAELINGQIYYMAAPNRLHQDILSFLHLEIGNYIRSKGGPCKVYPAPFAVRLKDDSLNYVEPDISVVCSPDKLDDKGCNGAPDWIIEIASPSNPGRDYVEKLNAYYLSGVHEYWIVNPKKETITIYDFSEDNFIPRTYGFMDKVKVNIYDDFEIDFKEMNI